MTQKPQSQSKIDCSIIIPNLHSPVIDRTIQSILAQETDHSFEILVVGMDKHNIISQFSESVVFYQTKQPTPPAISRNIGAKAATGERLFFIDADCIANPNWIETHWETQEKFIEPIIVGGGVTFSFTPFLTMTDNVSTFHEYMIHHPLGEKQLLPSLNLSIPKSIWNLLKGFNENYPYASGEDSDFAVRARKEGFKLIFEPKASIIHCPQRTNIKIIIEHAFKFGEFSIKGRREFWDTQFIPFPLRNWILALIFSPLISLVLILKIIFIEKLPFKYWLSLPLVFLYKIFWVLGYAKQLREQKR